MIEAMRAALRARLTDLGISTTTVPYPAHDSVEAGKALRGAMAGQFTKNLLLKDKKGTLFLIVADEDQAIDLRTLHTVVGARGRLGFASADQMRETVGVEPGALTPFALINDTAGLVTVVLDANLLGRPQLNFHPLVNIESTGLSSDGLLAFIASCGRAPRTVDFAAPPPEEG